MPLPKIEHPTFETEIPSTKQKVKYRPFTVKEHRMLMKAVEFKDPTNLSETFKNIVNACTFGAVDIDKMPMFDLDWLFLIIRASSTGGMVNTSYRCRGEHEGSVCGNKVNLAIDTSQVKVDVPPQDVKIIKISPTVGIHMRYPTFDDYVKKYNMGDDLQKISEELILDSIEMVYDADEMLYTDRDFSREELTEFLDDLDESTHDKIVDFIKNIPEIYMNLPVRCNKCGNASTMNLRGLNDFLG